MGVRGVKCFIIKSLWSNVSLKVEPSSRQQHKHTPKSLLFLVNKQHMKHVFLDTTFLMDNHSCLVSACFEMCMLLAALVSGIFCLSEAWSSFSNLLLMPPLPIILSFINCPPIQHHLYCSLSLSNCNETRCRGRRERVSCGETLGGWWMHSEHLHMKLCL